MDNNKQYEKTIAKLQTKVDLLEAELHYLNKLLVKVGFDEGTEGLKKAVEEVLAEGSFEDDMQFIKKMNDYL